MHSHRRTPRLIRIGLTGNVASGKSVVSDTWQSLGAVVIDADELARRAVEPGTHGLREVVRRFGDEVLEPDGRLDRRALRERVFADDAARRDLESILHPEIERLRREEERAAAGRGATWIVHSIPLLFETNMADRFDRIVLVDAPEPVRRARMIEHRGLDAAVAQSMIAAQMPSAAKRERADIVIDNTGSLDDLRRRAGEVWAGIVAEQ